MTFGRSPSHGAGPSNSQSCSPGVPDSPWRVKRPLSQTDEDQLGKFTTSQSLFKQRIVQGRGSTNCLGLELRDVVGGEHPGDDMEVSCLILKENQQPLHPRGPVFDFFVDGQIGPDLRAMLIQYGQTLGDTQPIRIFLSGHGARVTPRRGVVFCREQIVCKIWRPTSDELSESPVSKRKRDSCTQDAPLPELPGDSSHRSANADRDGTANDLWFVRLHDNLLMTQTQASTIADPLVRASSPASSQMQRVASVRSTPAPTAIIKSEHVRNETSGSIMSSRKQPVPSHTGNEVHLPSNPTSSQAANVSHDTAEAVSPWFDTPPGNKQGSLRAIKVKQEPVEHSSPSTETHRSASECRSSLTQSSNLPQRHLGVVQSLSTPAEAGRGRDDFGGPSSGLPSRQSMPSSKLVTTPLSQCKVRSAPWKLLAVVHASQEPRRTNGGSGAFSQHIVLADHTGTLRTMLFAHSVNDFEGIEGGVAILLEPLVVQSWDGQQDPRQGVGHSGAWRYAILSSPVCRHIKGTLRPSEDEFSRMQQLSKWYHGFGGREEIEDANPYATTRTLKRLCDLTQSSTFHGHHFDMLARVCEIFPGNGPNQPVMLYVTDFTSHTETRACYDQHLGYEEAEYQARTSPTNKKGGGLVLSIALWNKQALAIAGIQTGQYILLSGLRVRWHEAYGISAQLGTESDLNLKIRDAFGHPRLPELVERQSAWERSRLQDLQCKRALEEDNEAAWREAHASSGSGQEALAAHKVETEFTSNETNSLGEGLSAETHNADGLDGNAAQRVHDPAAVMSPGSIPATPKPIDAQRNDGQPAAAFEPSAAELQASEIDELSDAGEAEADQHTTSVQPCKTHIEDSPRMMRTELEEVHPHVAPNAAICEKSTPAAEQPGSIKLSQKSGAGGLRSVSNADGPSRAALGITVSQLPLCEVTILPEAASLPVVSTVQAIKSLSQEKSMQCNPMCIRLNGAAIIDIKPRDPRDWIVTKGDGCKIHFAILLHKSEDPAPQLPDAGDCLPIVISGQNALQFLGLSEHSLRTLVDRHKAIEEVRMKIEGLRTSSDRASTTEPSSTERLHEWALVVRVGQKTGQTLVSPWKCQVQTVLSRKQKD